MGAQKCFSAPRWRTRVCKYKCTLPILGWVKGTALSLSLSLSPSVLLSPYSFLPFSIPLSIFTPKSHPSFSPAAICDQHLQDSDILIITTWPCGPQGASIGNTIALLWGGSMLTKGSTCVSMGLYCPNLQWVGFDLRQWFTDPGLCKYTGDYCEQDRAQGTQIGHLFLPSGYHSAHRPWRPSACKAMSSVVLAIHLADPLFMLQKLFPALSAK